MRKTESPKNSLAHDLVYLDRNENNYGPAPACFEVLKNAGIPTLSTYSRVFTRDVKSILSERLAQEFSVPEAQILLGYGAEDLLKQVIRCYLPSGEKLMIPAYSWWYYKAIADEVGGKNIEYPISKGADSFIFDPGAFLEAYRRERPRVVFFTSPNNPTGNSIPLNEFKGVLGHLRDSFVVLDEAYVYNDEKQHVRDLIALHPRIMVIRTFSKYYALAGLRIGYAVCGTDLAEIAKYNTLYLGFNRLSQDVALAALDSPAYYRSIAEKMDEDKKRYYLELGRIPGFIVFKSDANFILVEIPPVIMNPLKEFLVGRGLVVKFMNEPLLHSHIRITLGTQEQNTRVIDAVREFAAKRINRELLDAFAR
jgi:histidinol-phosphate aminotransferase